MTTMSLILRTSVKCMHTPGSLFIRLIHNRRVKTITLRDCRLYPEEWDKVTRKIVYPEDDISRCGFLRKIEEKLQKEIKLVNGYIRQLELQGRYSVDDIVALYRQRQDHGKLLGYSESLALEMECRGQERTARAYRTVSRGLVQFNKGVDILLEHINSNLIKDFEIFLKENGKLPNTISYYMRNLRAIYNKAILSQRIVNKYGVNPFLGVYTGVTKTMKRALTSEEIKKLHSLDFKSFSEKNDHSVQDLYVCQRYFSFCFYARGMCFIDLAYLRKENIRGGFIRYVRKKTGQQMEVRIIPEMQTIMDSFANDVKSSPFLFPIIRNPNKKHGFNMKLLFVSRIYV